MARDKVRNEAGVRECRFLSLCPRGNLIRDRGLQLLSAEWGKGREEETLTTEGGAGRVCGVSRGLHRAYARIRCRCRRGRWCGPRRRNWSCGDQFGIQAWWSRRWEVSAGTPDKRPPGLWFLCARGPQEPPPSWRAAATT